MTNFRIPRERPAVGAQVAEQREVVVDAGNQHLVGAGPVERPLAAFARCRRINIEGNRGLRVGILEAGYVDDIGP